MNNRRRIVSDSDEGSSTTRGQSRKDADNHKTLPDQVTQVQKLTQLMLEKPYTSSESEIDDLLAPFALFPIYPEEENNEEFYRFTVYYFLFLFSLYFLFKLNPSIFLEFTQNMMMTILNLIVRQIPMKYFSKMN